MAKILLVDDVPEVRLVLRLMLERLGHRVVQADNGTAALAQAQADFFDLVLTDIWMPGGDGIALIQELRRLTPCPKIVAISGGAPRAPLDYSLKEASAAGADAVVWKPVDQGELKAALDGVLKS